MMIMIGVQPPRGRGPRPETYRLCFTMCGLGPWMTPFGFLLVEGMLSCYSPAACFQASYTRWLAVFPAKKTMQRAL